MKTAEQRKIEKLEELNDCRKGLVHILETRIANGELTSNVLNMSEEFRRDINRLESELSALDKEIEQGEEVTILSDISEKDKADTIDSFIRLTAKHTLKLFMMLGLKTHIEAKVVNDVNNEEYLFSFKKVQKPAKADSDKRKRAEDMIIEKVGDFWWICGKHRPEFLDAMLEFSQSEPKVPNEVDWHNAVMKLRKELKDSGADENFADINTWLMACEWMREQMKNR